MCIRVSLARMWFSLSLYLPSTHLRGRLLTYVKTVAKENLEILIPTTTQRCQLFNPRFLVQTHKKTILVKLLTEKRETQMLN